MKEIKHEIIVQGTPKIENIAKEDFDVLCTSLLCLVEDHYKYSEKEKVLGQKCDVISDTVIFPSEI